MLVRSGSLGATGVLREELQTLPNVKFRFHTEVTAVNTKDSKFSGVRIRDRDGTHNLTGDGLFVFVGLEANTQAFKGTLRLDRDDFIVTSNPRLATNVEGVFAAGDVRSGSTGQIAAAVGEGVDAALSVCAHLMALHRAKRHGTSS
jgi:thioredoxin reductase (NADPH)